MKRRGFFSRLVTGLLGVPIAAKALGRTAEAAPRGARTTPLADLPATPPIDCVSKESLDCAAGLYFLEADVLPLPDADENSAVFMDDEMWIKVSPMCAPFPEGWAVMSGGCGGAAESPRVFVRCDYCDSRYTLDHDLRCPGCGAPAPSTPA